MTSDLVVDASFVTALLSEGNEDIRSWATELVGKSELAAPHLMPVEVTSAFRRLERQGLLSSSLATLAQRDLTEIGVELFPFEPFAPRVWELRHMITPYDSWYVALAERLDAPLATLDTRLAHTTGARCTFLLPP